MRPIIVIFLSACAGSAVPAPDADVVFVIAPEPGPPDMASAATTAPVCFSDYNCGADSRCCNGRCVAWLDPLYCGDFPDPVCGETCQAGTTCCPLAPGYPLYHAICANLDADASHCGACGNACPGSVDAPAVCCKGVCRRSRC